MPPYAILLKCQYNMLTDLKAFDLDGNGYAPMLYPLPYYAPITLPIMPQLCLHYGPVVVITIIIMAPLSVLFFTVVKLEFNLYGHSIVKIK